MTAAERQQVRLSLLRYLDAAADASPGRGIGEAVLQQYLIAEGFSGGSMMAKAELGYLADKGFVVPVAKGLSPEIVSWRILAAGRDAYAQQLS